MSQRALSIELLEQQAAEQRGRLHDSVQKLRETVRDHMDPNYLLQGRFVPAAVIAGIVGLSLGYSFASIFRRK